PLPSRSLYMYSLAPLRRASPSNLKNSASSLDYLRRTLTLSLQVKLKPLQEFSPRSQTSTLKRHTKFQEKSETGLQSDDGGAAQAPNGGIAASFRDKFRP